MPCVLFLSTRQKYFLPCVCSALCVPRLAHGKEWICRVPVNLHTAKSQAHGKLSISGSGDRRHREGDREAERGMVDRSSMEARGRGATIYIAHSCVVTGLRVRSS